jgi:hypothetical protein
MGTAYSWDTFIHHECHGINYTHVILLLDLIPIHYHERLRKLECWMAKRSKKIGKDISFLSP